MSEPPIACTLSPEELACGAVDLLPGLVPVAQTVRPTPEGARLEFAGERGIVTRIAAVIERERLCCRFLRFGLDVAPDGGAVTLVLSGPPGTVAFLASLDPAFAAPTG